MRTREKQFRHYGICQERVQELLILAKAEENQELLQKAAGNSCAWLSEYLIRSLSSGIGYEQMYKQTYIPATKADFYAYRRKTLAAFHTLLLDAKEPHKT